MGRSGVILILCFCVSTVLYGSNSRAQMNLDGAWQFRSRRQGAGEAGGGNWRVGYVVEAIVGKVSLLVTTSGLRGHFDQAYLEAKYSLDRLVTYTTGSNL